MTTAGISPMPNKSTMKGIHAVGDMGRSNCTAGLTYLKIQGILPSINPKKTAAITELTYPVRKRYMLVPILVTSVPSPHISGSACHACSGEGNRVSLKSLERNSSSHMLMSIAMETNTFLTDKIFFI